MKLKKRKKGNKFKKGDLIKSQLPNPKAKSCDKDIYEVLGLKEDSYIVRKYMEKGRSEKVPTKLMDGGAYLDGKYIEDYIKVAEEKNGTSIKKNAKGGKGRSKTRTRKKTKPKTH